MPLPWQVLFLTALENCLWDSLLILKCKCNWECFNVKYINFCNWKWSRFFASIWGEWWPLETSPSSNEELQVQTLDSWGIWPLNWMVQVFKRMASIALSYRDIQFKGHFQGPVTLMHTCYDLSWKCDVRNTRLWGWIR